VRAFAEIRIMTTKATNKLTTSNGAPVSSLTASMTASPRGPIVLQDFTLLDHLAHFDRERIPERVVHAKGAGAFGYFQVTNAEFAKSICKAKVFEFNGKRTPVAVRFSTVGGESGSADTARDPRGFAVKFVTEEGNWDLVGNNTPIFFLRDPILFPSFIHTQKRHPATHLKDPDMMWDFIGLRPETVHQVSFLFSDRGTPDGYRHMNGYGSHAFKNVNEDGEAVWVKYHFKTDQGIANLSSEEASRMEASDPDYAIRDLYDAIANDDPPSWTMYVQVMSQEQANNASFDPFDLTKVWPHKDYPLQEVGRMVLNRNPANYFAEVEQLAFAPSHLVPGIEPSPDKMLQARLFSYPDTHRHRLGVNYQSIPVNKPFNADVSNYQRDGFMTVTANGGGAPNYYPNSFTASSGITSSSATPSPAAHVSGVWHSDAVSGDVKRYETGDVDNFEQCRMFFRNVLDRPARERLTSNIAGNIVNVKSDVIRLRAIANFVAVDPLYGRMISDKVKKLQEERSKEAAADVVSSSKVKKNVAPLNPPRTVFKPAVCPLGFKSNL